MPESPAAFEQRLVRDLTDYFALTTGVEMPRGVARMSARSLSARRGPSSRLALQVGALVATAAVAVAGIAVVRNSVHFGGGAALSTTTSGSGAKSAPYASAGAVIYPGVDSGVLGSARGTALLSPRGHGSATVSPAAAQAAALAAEGGGQRAAGPAVLAWVESSAGPAPLRCLCWVVGLAPGSASAASGLSIGGSPPSVLVFVDATTGRVDGAVAPTP